MIFPQTCPFMSLMSFVLQSGQIRVLYYRIRCEEGIGLLHSWLIMIFGFRLKKGTSVYAYVYHRGRL